jgi:hypothetical protein
MRNLPPGSEATTERPALAMSARADNQLSTCWGSYPFKRRRNLRPRISSAVIPPRNRLHVMTRYGSRYRPQATPGKLVTGEGR